MTCVRCWNARRAAVLVVATPCPLLLAAPVAIVSGLSRAARQGVIVRDGGALERLGRARTLLLDKTGTLTTGRPRVLQVAAAPGRTPSEVLRLVASLDQMSAHVLAEAIVVEARARGLALSAPQEVTEEPGRPHDPGDRLVGIQGRCAMSASLRPDGFRSAVARRYNGDSTSYPADQSQYGHCHR
ncbi:hypothetical protein AB0O28_03810 [Microbispora sp. NPDC088329]|uniref:hypothetical protein n=1 Tax=Microbispora sp. NPDC088329 TaxID=3154869 RepID=UPI003444A942